MSIKGFILILPFLLAFTEGKVSNGISIYKHFIKFDTEAEGIRMNFTALRCFGTVQFFRGHTDIFQLI